MSPRRATAGSYKPKEGRRFTRQIKVSLHDTEADLVQWLCDGETPAEWVRDAIRSRLARETAVREAGCVVHPRLGELYPIEPGELDYLVKGDEV